MTNLTLVRHGETDWNRQRRIQGATDIPLNDTGREQAREAGERLLERLDARVRPVVVSSDLSRARETAAIIAAVLDADRPLVYPSLRERAYGEAEGVVIDEVTTRFGSDDRDAVPGAETRQALRERAVSAVREVAALVCQEEMAADTPLIAVSHGAFIRELIDYTTGGALPEPGTRIVNGSAHDFLVADGGIRLLAASLVSG